MSSGKQLASKDPIFAFQSINTYHKWLRSSDTDVLRSLLEAHAPFKEPVSLPGGLTAGQVGKWLDWQDIWVEEIDQRLWPIRSSRTCEPSEHIKHALDTYNETAREFREVEVQVLGCLSLAKAALMLMLTEHISDDDRALFERFVLAVRTVFMDASSAHHTSFFGLFGRSLPSYHKDIEPLVPRVEQRASMYMRALSRGTSLDVELERGLERWSRSELLEEHRSVERDEDVKRLGEALNEAQNDEALIDVAGHESADVLRAFVVEKLTNPIVLRKDVVVAQLVDSEALDLIYVQWISDRNPILYEEPHLVLKAWLVNQRLGIFLARKILDVLEGSDPVLEASDPVLISLFVSALANDRRMGCFYMEFLMEHCFLTEVQDKARDIWKTLRPELGDVEGQREGDTVRM